MFDLFAWLYQFSMHFLPFVPLHIVGYLGEWDNESLEPTNFWAEEYDERIWFLNGDE
jgi:hypothetical protein